MNRLSARHLAMAGTAILAGVALAACGTGNATSAHNGGDYPTRLTLSGGYSDENYHPAFGHSESGVSMVYDGLLRPEPTNGPGSIPNLVPALADTAPKPSENGKTWTVTLRDNVTFSDGSEFDAADVKATYDVARDASTGSAISHMYSVIEDVEVVDKQTVAFHLNLPYGNFPARLTLGIAPSELVGEGTVDSGPLAQRPVGTGPYVLKEHTGNEARFTAREDYWAGASAIKDVVVAVIADDAARAQRVATGELSGAIIAPSMAKNYENRPGLRVVSTPSADWRSISLPDTPFLRAPEVRRALNLAVDRDAMVAGPMAGHGTPISHPISEFYGDAHNPDAVFAHDVAQAEKLLDDAGWHKGPDGVRAKDGVKAEIPLLYVGDDTMRRDMAVEFAAQMEKTGVKFTPQASNWDEITPQMDKVAVVLAGGTSPYDVDLLVYDLLHSRQKDTSEYDNPGDHGSPELDAALDKARAAQDPQERAQAYRDVQELYLDNPSSVFLAYADHVYLEQENTWDQGSAVLEPHLHSATWGPWWNLGQWKQ